MITDNELLELYMWGFRDGLNDITSTSFKNRNYSLTHKAYYLGKDNAESINFDDNNLQTNEQILNRIKNYSEEELKQIFENRFDCYADTINDRIIMAMSKERYLEVLKELNIIS